MNQQQCIFCGHIDHDGARQGQPAGLRAACDYVTAVRRNSCQGKAVIFVAVRGEVKLWRRKGNFSCTQYEKRKFVAVRGEVKLRSCKGNLSCTQYEERKNQQDATIRCLLSTSFSTCFGHHYVHLQEIKDRVTAFGVLLWFCWMWLVAVVGCCVVGCEHYEGFCFSLHTLLTMHGHRKLKIQLYLFLLSALMEVDSFTHRQFYPNEGNLSTCKIGSCVDSRASLDGLESYE